MSTTRTVSIIAPAGGRKNYVANDVPVLNLATYSLVARARFYPGKDTKIFMNDWDKRNTSNPDEFDLGEGMDEGFARIIATHIKNADTANPAPLTLALFGTERSLHELVQIYRLIGLGYKLPRELHDDDIREDLRRKMYDTTPFLFSHFKLVTSNLFFDRGVLHSVMDRVAFLHIKGYLDEDTKMEVERYCKAREGWWEQLLETVGRVQDKINEAAEQKAARDKAKERKDQREGKKTSQGGNGRGAKGTSSGKASTGKGKGKKSAQPFVRKDEDFPPLS